MEEKRTYTEEEIANALLKYTISENAFINDKKDAKKAIAHNLNILKNNVHYFFEDKQQITIDDIDIFFPFLNVDSKEFVIDENLIDRTIILCEELNAYIKEKQFEPKQNRIFYDMKAKLIILLRQYTDRVIDEWSEKRTEDGEQFASYVIRINCRKHAAVFHQPFRNVECMYKRTAQKEKLFNTSKPYHYETSFKFALNDETKKEMIKAMNLFSIYGMVIRKYIIKRYNQEKQYNNHGQQ